MRSRKQSETGIIASILIPTLATILGGIVLLWIEYRVIHRTGDAEGLKQLLAQLVEQQQENERLKADLHHKNYLVDRLAAQQKEAEMLHQRQKQSLLDQLAEQQKEIELFKEQKQRLSDRLAEQQQEIAKLKSDLRAIKETAAKERETPPPLKLNSAASTAKTVLLHYRVPKQIMRQIPYAGFEETAGFLKRLHLSYRSGPPWKNSGLSPLYVPTLIDTASWQCYVAKNEGHRERLRSKMIALGIQTSIDKPEDIDD